MTPIQVVVQPSAPLYRVPSASSLSKAKLFWRPHPQWAGALATTADGDEGLPVNQEEGLAFSTELFEGVCHLWVKGLDGSVSADILQGNQTLFTVTGRFKKAGLKMSDIVTGQEFSRPIANVPGKWLFNAALKFAQTLRPMSDFGDLDDPYMRTPLICAGTCLIASGLEGNLVGKAQAGGPDGEGGALEEKEAPEDQDSGRDSGELGAYKPVPRSPAPRMEEDCRLLGEEFIDLTTGGPASAEARKRVFCSPEALEEGEFNVSHMYTFTFFQSYMDMSNLELNLGYGMCFDMARHMDGQPFQLRCKQKSTGLMLWDFEIWQQSLLEAALAYEECEGQPSD